MHPTQLTLRLVLLPAVAALLTTGCLFSPDKKPDPEPPTAIYLQPTSEANVLANLVTAYRFREIEPYDAVTHEDFVFKASENDPDVTFDRLGALQDRESTENMFNQVISIDINLEHGAPEASDVADYQGSEYSKIFVPQVYISVETRIDGDLWTLKVEGDPAKFIFKRDDSVDPPTYAIIFQQDLHQGRVAGEALAQVQK